MTLAFTNRKALSLAIAAIVVAVGLAAGTGVAQAHHNNTAFVQAGFARCDAGNRIVVHAPIMGQAWPRAIVGGSQKVAFKSHLARFYPGTGWQTVLSGIWKTTRVNDYGLIGGWTTLEGAPIDGTMSFYGLPSGTNQNPVYYKVFTEYYWYADLDLGRHEGYLKGWNPHEEWRGNYRDQKTYDHCKLPGPNDVTIIG